LIKNGASNFFEESLGSNISRYGKISLLRVPKNTKTIGIKIKWIQGLGLEFNCILSKSRKKQDRIQGLPKGNFGALDTVLLMVI
jgi:hypothetical protein